MSGLHLPPAEPPADDVLELAAQLDAARAELHEAQRIVALLDDEEAQLRTPVAVARNVIEYDLAVRRVDAWTAIVDRLRDNGRGRGLFG